jgi:hypothetical protein
VLVLSAPVGIGAGWILRSFDDVKNLIQTRNIQSPEQLVAALPDSYHENFVLMNQSGGSPDQAKLTSSQRPRLIAFGSPGNRVILAFASGSNRVEAIDFDGQVFHPHVVDFPKIDFEPKVTPEVDSVRFDHGVETCEGCHTADTPEKRKALDQETAWRFHPNWDAYPLWPGAFAENFLFHNPPELQAADSFLKTAMGKGIYSHLKFRYADPRENSEAARMLSSLDTTNGLFSAHLQRFNAQRIVARMQRLPDFESYRVKLIRSLLFFYPKHGAELFPDTAGGDPKAYEIGAALKRDAERYREQVLKRSPFQAHLDYQGVNLADRFGQFVYVYSRLDPSYANEIAHWPLQFSGYYGDLHPQVHLDGPAFGLEEALAIELLRPLLGNGDTPHQPLSVRVDERQLERLIVASERHPGTFDLGRESEWIVRYLEEAEKACPLLFKRI